MENLLDKTVAEATALLEENSCRYSQDYGHMGPEAFVFYVEALANYLDSRGSDEDGDFAYFMIRTFTDRLKWDGMEIAAAVPTMRRFCARAVADFERLGFEEKYRKRLGRRVAEFEVAVGLLECPPASGRLALGSGDQVTEERGGFEGAGPLLGAGGVDGHGE